MIRAICCVIFLVLSRTSAFSTDYPMVDVENITKQIELSLAQAKEILDNYKPPRYKLYKAIITFSVTSDENGELKGKIPAVIVDIDVTGAYSRISTSKLTLKYYASQFVRRSSQSSGLLNHIVKLQERLSKLEMNAYLVKQAIYEEDFVVKKDASGDITFLDIAKLLGGAEIKNSHHAKYYFCLADSNGDCEKSNEENDNK